MKGSILIFKPGAIEPEIRHFTRALDLDDLKDAIGGGYIEVVPGFDMIEHDGKEHRCVAFCDEEGKLGYRTTGSDWTAKPPDPPNLKAIDLWMKALRRRGIASPRPDYLVGQIAVVIGDAAFLQAL